ncbi:acyltransferase domain-containing protein [Paenibacillus koleovorans]|uniref:acyltransferase domain-containing protein n=1 Tax=Paenibacillus koleovorans TaxID=121608 RepID=UPI000FD952B9|nr:acyltransferase domain-containing protein [Paenibacillus koleovorans]
MVNENEVVRWLTELGIDSADIPDDWKRNVGASEEAFSPSHTPFFLEAAYLEKACLYTAISQEYWEPIQQTAALIRSSLPLAKLACLWHTMLFIRRDITHSWPLPVGFGEELADWFPMVVLLSGCDHVKRLYAERGIPEPVVRDTLWDVNNGIHLIEERYGLPGLNLRLMHWLSNHFRAELYKLGRLQFGIRKIGNYLHAYRHKETGETIALSAAGHRYRQDGLIDGTNKVFDPEYGWVAVYTVDESTVTGHPISTEGYASQSTVTLLLDEWELALSPGDTVFDCHIPAQGRLTPELADESYRLALDFFPRYYPELTFKAYTCYSWLLDPQLRSLLPADSNIVKFQLSYSLFPIGGGDDSFFYFVFMCDPCEPHAIPATSSIQQTIKRYMLDGGRMRAMGGFFLAR